MLDFKTSNANHRWIVKNSEDNCGVSGGLHFINASKKTRMSITQSGNVGIGTSNPNAMLLVGNVGDNDNTKMLGFSEGRSANIWFQSGFSPSGGNNYIQLATTTGNLMTWKLGGNVGIGTTNPTAKLTVAGDIHAREVRVTTNAGADFVFEKDYTLRPLSELDAFVQENKHLPEIAPAAQMVEEGVNAGEFQIQLLQKIEELTLYVIEQEKRVKALETENENTKNVNKGLR